MDITESDQEINIQPTTAVYKTFERYNYTQSTAYAEFIDNSTQSFFDHRDELQNCDDFDHCIIDIHHNSLERKITISDNCFGMDEKDFKRAIILNSAPEKKTGRNEFGMGLKAAASWFGRKWTVVSTRLGSTIEYSATIDTELLAITKSPTVTLIKKTVPPESHYTVITIEDVLRDYPQKKSMSKLRQDIGGIYRRDIADNSLVILYNDEALSYKPPSILKTDENGSEKEWKVDLNYEIPYKDEIYTVTGFVAIREKASPEYAGLTLFRRNRVIVGGFSGTYRPKEIFGQSNSFVYQRLFGEINLDNWPVSQAKDQFTWGEDLEGIFKSSINERIGELKKQAQTYRARKNKKDDETPSSQTDSDSVSESGSSSSSKSVIEDQPNHTEHSQSKTVPSNNDKTSIGSPNHNEPSTDMPANAVPESASYMVSVESVDYSFHIHFKELESNIMFSKSTKDNAFEIYINLNHPIIAKASLSKDAMTTAIEFIIYLALSEKMIDSDTSSPSIGSDSIRLEMNNISFNHIKEVNRCQIL